MNLKYASFLLFFIVAGYAFADGVVYETDFQSAPEDWNGSGWTFGDDGAVSDRDCSGWEDVLFTQLSGDYAERIYFIPDGTDSLLFHIPYYIFVNNSEVSGGATFNISAYIDEASTREQIFSLSVWQAGVYEYDESVEYVFNHRGSGWLGFFIEFAGGCEPGCGIHAVWQIHGITVTAYGDDLDLEPLTWASIKSTYRFLSD